MSENPIIISNLNDFIFCPASIYFHMLDEKSDSLESQDVVQINGTAAHICSDNATYSTKKSMLQGISVYSSKYNILGKIDTFDSQNGVLTERKKHINVIYDGYIFQLFAQYYCLTDMGYVVKEIRLYSIDNNKVYNVELPEKNRQMRTKFLELIKRIQSFSLFDFLQTNQEKCSNCIYEPLCSFSKKD